MSNIVSLERSTPEAEGTSSAIIREFVEGLEEKFDSFHSIMLLRHGKVVAEGWWEPYRRDDKHLLFSLSKSFTSSAIGLLIAEGKVSLDDPVLSFFPAEAPPNPGENLRAMQVRHLLAMSTGHTSDTTDRMLMQPGKTWVEGFLSLPVEREPGTHFLYNTGASYMLSAIVQRVTGEKLIDYLKPRLFDPLGIADPDWEESPEGINFGGWGLSATTEDVAAFGQLYLQKGRWGDRQLLPEAWVEEATRLQTPNGNDKQSDWNQGYGYQFWMCRYNAYRGDGAFGQYCVILPEQDAVLVMTAGMEALDMQLPLDWFWKAILPALGDKPLPENQQELRLLREKMAGLQLPTIEGEKTNATARHISGKTFVLDKNSDGIEAITLDFSSGEAVVTLTLGSHDEQEFTCGYKRWVRSTTGLDPAPDPFDRMSLKTGPWEISACGAWTADNVFASRLAFYKTPFVRTFVTTFTGHAIKIDQRVNVSFGPLAGRSLTGRLRDA